MSRPRRPLVRYHGGKWKLADWIISYFPAHRIYVEPFGGGGSVLLKKQRAYAEVYNDLDGEIVNLFRVARDFGRDLRNALELTPFAREEFEIAWHPSDEPLEQARRTVIRACMGFGSAAATMARSQSQSGRGGLAQTGFRANSNRSGTTPAQDWRNFPECLPAIIDRLRGVVIENRSAIKAMTAHDGPETLHYVDPPYVMATRDGGGDYAFEMTDDDHVALAAALKCLKGAVIVSGYDCPLYQDIFGGWRRIDKDALADGARKRVESLWLSPGVTDGPLFDHSSERVAAE